MTFQGDTDPRKIADDAVSTWRDVNAVLSPIIGQRGVAGLYKRSLHLVLAEYPWFAPVEENSVQPGEFTPLRHALSQQTSSISRAASGALQDTFFSLLANLIGVSLTAHLLQSIRNSSPCHATRDVSR